MTISAPDMPGDVWVCDADGGNMRRITDLNQDFFQKVKISLPEHLTFKGEDGGEYEGWVLKPVGWREGERYPLILDVHGGPHGAYGNSFPILYWHMLTGRGYGVLAINPRGSGGYGEDFAGYIKGAWGIRDFPDFMGAVDAIIKQDWVDPEKLGVTGYSYGGYMTNWIAGHTDRFKAAVSGGCVSDLISFFGTSDIGAPFFENEIGGRPDEMRQKYIELSPVTYVDKITTPMLLMHGEADDRCPIGQSEEMFVGLRRLGKPVEFVRYPGSSHLMFRTGPPSHRVDNFRRLVDGFALYIRPDSYGA
jgi:dipeptidyl aminopeptidase/acylaminoacyl peptidase